MYQPLAEIMRPQEITQVIGQDHLCGKGMPLATISNNKPTSIILWGPPGVGKTTLANILIKTWDCEAIKLSAIFSGIKEIKEALDVASKNAGGESLFNKPVVLFIDEIHRFNKAQQDAFLHHLESGEVTIIGATTENPSFSLNNALLSRMQVLVLKALDSDALYKLLDLALEKLDVELLPDARDMVVDIADGDGRRLFNLLEMISTAKVTKVDAETLRQLIPNSFRRFDKGGEEFYNQISALHKSVRGSDPDASLYWFMRMIDGGADPLYIGRRVLRMAWEDIGLADINAASVVNNALQTYERLGSPEGELALASAVVYLAVTPKSNSMELAYNKVRDFVAKDTSKEVPIHLRNAPTKLMAELGYAKEYKYAHDYPNHYVPGENYWPDEANPQQFYEPTNQGLEARVVERLKFLKNLDKQTS